MQDTDNEFLSPEESETSSLDTSSAEENEILHSDSRAPDVESTSEIEGTEVPVDSEVDEVKEESRARRFFRKFIRWTAGLLIIFGLGFLTAIFIIYNPKLDELDQSQTELDDASTTISSLENQISDLQEQMDDLNGQITSLNQEIETLKAQNLELIDQQTGFNLHIALLNARVDVVSAQVELYDGNPAQARVLLENTSQTLSIIEGLLPEDLKDVVTPLLTRLDLAISEIDTNPETAIADLGILAGDLLEIENALFSD